MNLSRRGFLESALASMGFASLGGAGRLFAAPQGWKPAGTPNLVFGVVSDTHIRTAWDGKRPWWRFPIKYFEAALEYFKAAGVDAVVHCGDFAHRGMMMSLQFHADAWKRVFGETGGPVKLLVSGNHDIIGGSYSGGFAAKVFPDEAERRKWELKYDTAEKWSRVWGEPYEPVWHKVVKGYHFFGRQWETPEMKLAPLVKKVAKEGGIEKGGRPFFVLSHVKQHAPLSRALAPWPNAVGFFGHWHNSATSYDRFRFYSTGPSIMVPSCEPRGTGGLLAPTGISHAPLEGKENAGKTRQGYVVRVYDDLLSIERREFGEGGSLGPDWVMPLGWGTGNGERETAKHPFSIEELKKVIGEPQFRKGARLTVECRQCGDAVAGNPALRITIPLAAGNPGTRVFAYDVTVESGNERILRSVYAKGCNMGIGHETDGGTTALEIPADALPDGDRLAVSVRPITSLGTKGRAISAETANPRVLLKKKGAKA